MSHCLRASGVGVLVLALVTVILLLVHPKSPIRPQGASESASGESGDLLGPEQKNSDLSERTEDRGLEQAPAEPPEDSPNNYTIARKMEKASGDIETMIRRIERFPDQWEEVRKWFTEDDVPNLIHLIENGQYKLYRKEAIIILEFVDTHGESQAALIEFIRRNNLDDFDRPFEARNDLLTKTTNATLTLALVGDQQARTLLRSMLFEEGVVSETQSWINEELPLNWNRGQIITSFRQRAASALVIAGDQQGIQMVERLFETTKAELIKIRENRLLSSATAPNQYEQNLDDFYFGLVSAMVLRDMRADFELDELLKLGLHAESYRREFQKYSKPYMRQALPPQNRGQSPIY